MRIRVKEHVITVPRLPRRFSGYRILQISDVHLGRGHFTERLLKTISQLSGDLLAFTGDIVDHPDFLPLLRPFLSRVTDTIHPSDGFVGVLGNHDRQVTSEHIDGLPIRWLRNQAVQIRRDSEFISLIGVNQQRWASTDLLAALSGVVPGGPMILIAHYPSTAYLLNGFFDLVIAGHTHAGQIRIPGLPFGTNDNLSWRNAVGVSTLGKTTLVVSGGIGYSGRIAVRLFAPPEITVIELRE